MNYSNVIMIINSSMRGIIQIMTLLLPIVYIIYNKYLPVSLQSDFSPCCHFANHIASYNYFMQASDAHTYKHTHLQAPTYACSQYWKKEYK